MGWIPKSMEALQRMLADLILLRLNVGWRQGLVLLSSNNEKLLTLIRT